MRVDVGDIELYVHERGDGSPIVALHGGPGLDGSVWFPALDPLAEDGFRILAVDHRGNGRVSSQTSERSSRSPPSACVAKLRLQSGNRKARNSENIVQRAKRMNGAPRNNASNAPEPIW